MSFSNIKIDPDELPAVAPKEYDELESGYSKVIFFENLILSFILLGAMTAAYFFDFLEVFGAHAYIPFIGISILLLFIFWFRPRAFSRKGYQIRQHDIIFKSGLWWTEEVAVPFVRVQHSEITQGPIGRWLGYSTLKLYTAGGSQSDLSIPALLPKTAEKLKAFIAQKTIEKDEAI